MKNGIIQIKWAYYNIKEELIAMCIANTRYEAISYFDEIGLDITDAHHSVRMYIELKHVEP